MNKLGKRLMSLGVVSVLAVSMAGCTSNEGSQTTSKPTDGGQSSEASKAPDKESGKKTEETAASNEIEKPDKITFMVNGTLLNEASGQEKFRDRFKEITGVTLEVIQPDHNAYQDQLAIAFTSGMKADVVLLSADYYPAYAAQGALWDMTDAWESSETKASGRINEKYINDNYIDGKLYGFPNARGNGCMTYMRKDWLDKLGLEVPTTYEGYINVLKAFTENDPDGNGANDTYGVTAPGLIQGSTYLPEIFQGAYIDFLQDENGTWVDGFLQPNMLEALQRAKDAYQAGYVDMEVATNKTSTCRDKFYAGKVGAFTYWAGKWNATLEDNVKALNPDAELVALAPIEELDGYYERQTPVLAITNTSKNPEAVFKYFIETMVDGGDGQMLFTYGVEGVHYEQKDGQYVQLPSLENPDMTFTCAFTDSALSISEFKDGDPLESIRDPRAASSNEVFVANAITSPMFVSNDTTAQYAATLKDLREVIITDVVTGAMTPQEGIDKYIAEGGTMSEEILASLNK